MSLPKRWPFHHEGIIIERSEFKDGAQVLIEWSEDPKTFTEGFILLAGLKLSKVYLLQSIATKEILICKVLDHITKRQDTHWIPPEFRISTAPIVVGDFGEAAMVDWPDEWITQGVFDYNSDELMLWEDLVLRIIILLTSIRGAPTSLNYNIENFPAANQNIRWAMGENLLLLAQAHIPFAQDIITDSRPFIYPVRTVNNYINPPDNPYSQELIDMLNCFEYPFYNQIASPSDVRTDADGVSRPRYEWLPEFDEIEHIWLPIMRRRVKRYRGIVGLPLNYYDKLDVSWSKPNHLMPYEVETEPTIKAPPIPRPPQQRAQSEGPPQSQQSSQSPQSPQSQQSQQDQQDQHPNTPIVPNALLTELRGIPHLQNYQHRLLVYKDPYIDEASISPPPGPLPPPPPGGDSGESDSESDDDYESSEPDDDEEDKDYVP
ncbi:hypothetical protein F4774DRAFT_427069 [Daldinia eschscholtzii]|nr:hypothetical protein F4774DRAFT_427069 [Daldinia eschscholtzii]